MTPADGTSPRPGLLRHLVLALLAYVPLLLTAPGRVAADTKTYLYLDPGRLLERAPFMWDPNVGLGTVTHQNIGYLFPMGPWYWVFERLGFPDWVAQRLWIATIMFAAGSGVLFLLRSLRWDHDATDATEATEGGPLARVGGGGALAAAVLYMLSPYLLHYGARISVLLLAWAGLPWLVGLVPRALQTGSWRHPALFAVVVTAIGGVNATALILAGVAPLLFLPFAIWAQREATVRRALATVAKIGVLTLGCSLWWLAGLAVQGGYGIDVLQYSETVSTVAYTSSSAEVLRGLGYWFFYGGDKVDRWIEPARGYLANLGLIAVSFAAPGLALLAGLSTRWRYRAYFVALVFVGTAVAVGAFPYESPSPIGAVFKAVATSSTAGLALRSTPRAVPLVALGLAVLLGSGVAAVGRRLPRLAVPATAVVVVIAVLGLPALWTGGLIGKNLQRPEEIPRYWEEAAAYLDGRGEGTRVVEIPGADFASYRWGTTVDPVTPGLMDRPYAARELIPYGSEPSADLLIALDRKLQESIFDPSVVGPVARRLGAGDVVLRSDLQYERYRTPRPGPTWAALNPPPTGLGEPVGFGEPRPNRAIERLPLRDELEISTPPDSPDPPPVAVFPVDDALPIVRAQPMERPMLLAGDGEGVVAAAAAGMLDGEAPVFYSAALADDPELRGQLLDAGAELVLTDTNRRRARRWSGLLESTGATEPAGWEPLEEDRGDRRLPLFPEAGDDAFTTAEMRGVRSVRASSYGNPVTYIPEARAASALDGDLETSWRTGDFSAVGGERLVIELDEPVTTDRVEVVQPLVGARNRFITRVGVLLDDREVGSFDLDDSSRQAGGQALDVGRQTFSRIELVVEADNIGRRRRYSGLSPVGFAEVRIAAGGGEEGRSEEVRVDEVVRLPSDLLDAAGPSSADHDLTVLVERARSNVVDTGRQDEERSMVRAFSLPTARRFALEGEARLSAYVPEPEIDALLGIRTPAEGGITARSSTYLQGILGARASSALDGDATTTWTTRFSEAAQRGAFIDVELPAPLPVDRLDLELVADGDHSVPTRLRIEGGGEVRTVDVPPVADGDERGVATPVTVRFPALTTDRLKVVVEDIRPVTSIDYFSEVPVVRPIAVAELGIPGAPLAVARPELADRCRDDLLEIDRRPVPLLVTGSTEDAGARSGLGVELCGGADDVTLPAGDHVLRATPGATSGLDLDRLRLRSPVGPTAAPSGPAPVVEVLDDGRTSLDLAVRGATEPFWLVLGQSHNLGWTAEVEGGQALGEPTVVDGFANGWYVEPNGEEDLSIAVEWVPQRGVTTALVVSAVFFLVCLTIAVVGWRRSRSARLVPAPEGVGPLDPQLVLPWAVAPRGERLRPRRAIAIALGCALVAALVVSPLVGLGVLVATALALRVGRRGRLVLAVGGLTTFGLAVAYILARQARSAFLPDFEWPTYFGLSHALAWTAVLLLGVDVVIDLVSRSSQPGPEADT